MKLAILSESFIVNSGLQFVFNKMRGISVVETACSLPDLMSALEEHQIDFLLVSDVLFKEDEALEQLYKTNKELRWGLIRKGEISLNSLFNFELDLSLTDGEELVLRKITDFVEMESRSEVPHNESELSEREKEILMQVAQGLTNHEIAEKLFISQHTVITHRKKITAKLGIKTISGLTVYALLNGLIEMGDVGELK